MTKNKGIYFKRLELKNVRSFGPETVLNLTDKNDNWCKWNVILGDNGLGKTFLLQCLSGFEFQNQKLFEEQELDEWLSILFNRKFSLNIFNKHILNNAIIKKEFQAEIEVVLSNYVEKLNFGQRYPSRKVNSTIVIRDERIQELYILGYGANRYMSNAELKESKSENSATLFDDDAKLINAEEWLLQLDYAASRESEIKEFATKKRNKIKEVLIELLPDVYDIRFTEPTREQMIPKIEFNTSFGWFGIRELSLGYKTMIAWVVDLAARMFDRYPESENPLSEPVVVLVDEIDLHLHPKWQRNIFSFLSSRFQNAQFIVTAHSPLVVQSAPENTNLILLKREHDENGNEFVSINSDIHSVHNWRLDQIMTSDLFDIGARNPEIEKQLQERKALIQKESLTDLERNRLKELNNLSDSLPTASNPLDIEAMEIIRRAAKYLKDNGTTSK